MKERSAFPVSWRKPARAGATRISRRLGGCSANTAFSFPESLPDVRPARAPNRAPPSAGASSSKQEALGSYAARHYGLRSGAARIQLWSACDARDARQARAEAEAVAPA